MRKAFTVASFEPSGSGTFFFLRSLFIVILKRLAAVGLRRDGELEDVAMMQPSFEMIETYYVSGSRIWSKVRASLSTSRGTSATFTHVR